MDLNEAERRIAERLDGLATDDVGVEVSVVPAGWLSVDIWSRHPISFWRESIYLHSDGRIDLPAPDDGCTPLSAPTARLGSAGSVDEAVELIVPYAEKAVAALRDRQAKALASALPTAQPAVANLGEACELWQGGRDVGSSLGRGAAGALTGIDHYFHAQYIAEHTARARRSRPALEAAIALLRGVNTADRQDADGWCAATGLPTSGFAGRGLAEKPHEDPQILRTLGHGQITMPLWGVSLDRSVAEGYGTRFLFEIVGEFPAVPAWVASGIKSDEQELVTGGRYRVLSMEDVGSTTHVRLEWMGAAGDKVGSDPLLLDVLGTVDGVTRSSLTRSLRDWEKLEIGLPGYGNSATVTRKAGAEEVEVVRYWEPPYDPNAKDDSPYTQHRAMLDASRTTTVPADVESIVTAVRETH